MRWSQYASCLYFSVASRRSDSLGSTGSTCRRNVLAAEIGEEAGRSSRQGAGAAVGIDLAYVSEVGGASCVGGAIWRGEHEACDGRVLGGDDVLEDVALGDDHGARVNLKGVARVGVPVVVDGVEESVAGHLGATARGMVDIVVLEGDEIGGTGEVEAPVVMAVAGGRPGGGTVDLAVGDCHAVGGAVAEDEVLAADEVGGDMVDPDHVGAVKCDGCDTSVSACNKGHRI